MKNYTREFSNMEDINLIDSSSSYYTKENKNIVFIPNVSKQRYKAVIELLTHAKLQNHVSTVTEYGCASFKFFPYLKNARNVKEINFVDIDDFLLGDKVFFIRPLLYDHLTKRLNPLKVKIYEGSISDPDWRILKTDAVVGIEIIEHLFPDTLEALPYVIFHSIKPKTVIFTTPNADFNVALPKFKQFRHPDHKFEWTREQFESWASNITIRFPDYLVNFFGIGKGPRGTADLGHCSQLCIFVRRDILDPMYNLTTFQCFCGDPKTLDIVEENSTKCLECFPMQSFGICTYLSKSKIFEANEENDSSFFKSIETIVYPHKEDDLRTKDEHILDAVKNRIYNSFDCINEDGVIEIPLYTIRVIYQGLLVPVEAIKEVLLLNGYEIKDCIVKNCNGEGMDDLAPCVLYQRPETPSSGTETPSDKYGECRSSAEESLSDWDAENTTLIHEDIEVK